jgi:hypothetical protein
MLPLQLASNIYVFHSVTKWTELDAAKWKLLTTRSELQTRRPDLQVCERLSRPPDRRPPPLLRTWNPVCKRVQDRVYNEGRQFLRKGQTGELWFWCQQCVKFGCRGLWLNPAGSTWNPVVADTNESAVLGGRVTTIHTLWSWLWHYVRSTFCS